MLRCHCSLLVSGLTSQSQPVAEGCDPALQFSLCWLCFPLGPQYKLLSPWRPTLAKSKQTIVICQFSVTVEAGLCWLIKGKYINYFWTSFSWTSKLVWQIIPLWSPTIWTLVCLFRVPSVKQAVQWYQKFWTVLLVLFLMWCDIQMLCWQHSHVNRIHLYLTYALKKHTRIHITTVCLIYLRILSIFSKLWNSVSGFPHVKIGH